MTAVQRFRNILGGLFRILIAVVLLWSPQDGYELIVFLLSVSLILSGFRSLVFYVSMARHMAGGRIQLFKGLVLLDFGLLTATASEIPKLYVLLYLLIIHAFSGGISVMRALEARRNEAGSWKLTLAVGIADILVAVGCLFSLRSVRLLIIIYAAGLIYAAVLQIVSALRKTAVVYIP